MYEERHTGTWETLKVPDDKGVSIPVEYLSNQGKASGRRVPTQKMEARR